jgi:hypothetical protein
MRRVLVVALLTVAAPAAADAPLPSVNEVVQKARAVMERKPDGIVCALHAETEVRDKAGKIEHTEDRKGKATLHGDDQEVETESAVRDGKPMTAAELKAEHDKLKQQRAKRKKSDDDFDLSPFAASNAASETFELVRRETLWGRPALVLTVHAKENKPTLPNGTVWIDAESFVELKGELAPSQNPEHVDWLKVQEQYTLGPGGVPVPSYLYIEGGGHFLFMKKQFRSTVRWSGCR